jgi:hypothetical protein
MSPCACSGKRFPLNLRRYDQKCKNGSCIVEVVTAVYTTAISSLVPVHIRCVMLYHVCSIIYIHAHVACIMVPFSLENADLFTSSVKAFQSLTVYIRSSVYRSGNTVPLFAVQMRVMLVLLYPRLNQGGSRVVRSVKVTTELCKLQ